ncbi:MAG: ATP-dependent DNA helicase RecG [Clostridiales bacterium]|nr:ATP-dependent DNA helicase RecG [Clostridiales bacterium]
MLNVNSNIQFIKGVGEKRARLFNSLGIFDVDSLIHFYPRKYEDWSKTKTVKEALDNEVVCIRATMITPVKESMIRKGLTLYKCRFSDGESIVDVTIFNNKYLAKSLRIYDDYLLFGKIEKNFTKASMSAPKIEKSDTGINIHPIYSATGKLTSKAILKVMRTALDEIGEIEETLTEEIKNKYNLISLDKAIRYIHFPRDEKDIVDARNRLIFEELLTLQLGLLKLKGNKKRQSAYKITSDYTDEFIQLLPFSLTNAQKKAMKECIDDLEGEHPMSRLIQGDVGSGKTAVAAGVLYTVIKNGYQGALMAPTEILAKQHYESLSKLLDGTGIRTGLLTGSVKASEKREIKSLLINGEIDLLIGTHALIQNDVEFKRLGLVITDEQHRFGVKQRAELANKGDGIHTLVMSATPIPRTLGLILYGDLDISIIDELPPGRQEIRTDVVNSSYNNRLYKFIKNAVDRGEQCYIICPAVDENELGVKSAEQYADELSEGAFNGYNLGLLHGKLKPKEKESVMKAFVDGDIKILVATTVVEVGVDVPNATIMVIENAERFGLSQLHQLRGRIGRGNKKSYCVLVSDSESENAQNRLMTMKRYTDGFKIADEDLKIRGPGDFFGEKQHGLPDLKIADMVDDVETLRLTQHCAKEILSNDFNLEHSENKNLSKRIDLMFKNIEY